MVTPGNQVGPLENHASSIKTLENARQVLKDHPIMNGQLRDSYHSIPIKNHQVSVQAEESIRNMGLMSENVSLEEHSSKAEEFPAGLEALGDKPGKKLLSSRKSPEVGEVLGDKFLDPHGNHLCEEKCERAKTMDIYKAQLKNERDYLLREINRAQTGKGKDPNQLHPIRERIKRLDEKIKIAEIIHASWASTNSPRMLFDKHGPEKAKEIGIPVVVNLRSHGVAFQNGNLLAFNRSAALSDFTHGQTNLAELKDYLILSDSKNIKNLSQEQKDYFRYYYRIDIDDPAARWPVENKMKNIIFAAYGTSEPAKLNQIISERRDLLRTQALQDLLLHFKRNPVAQESMIYSRVALLAPEKPESKR